MTTPIDTPLADPRLLNLRVANHSEYEHKVVWSEGGLPIATYHIDRHRLIRMSAQVRMRLQELVKQARDERKGGVAQCGGQLKNLAVAGNELFETLFRASDDRQGNADKAKLRLQRHHPRRIHVIVDPLISVPWGLVFVSDPTAQPGGPADTDISRYGDFWCLRHWLCTTFERIEHPDFDGPIADTSFHVLPVFNRAVLQSTQAALTPDELAGLNQHFLAREPVYSKQDLLQRWKGMADRHGLVYFVCHANGTNLELGVNDLITIDDFTMKLIPKGRRDESAAYLFFLNGCITAVGEAGGGFLEATGTPGSLGFIGTESKVPDVFAMRFGLAFVRQLLQSGDPLFRVMDTLRRRHWPLGLLYSIYCFPLLQVQPAVAPPPPDESNYSTMLLGSNDL